MKLLALLLLAPLLSVLAEAASPGAFAVWTDLPRLARLFADTLLLSGLTLVLAMPIGIALAVLLERTDLPARNACRLLLLPMMWLPAEVTAIQWQNLLTLAIPGEIWVAGLLPAAWIHATIALPWIVFLLSLGLRSVDPDIEAEGLLHVGPWSVLRRLTFPASSPLPRLAVALVLIQTMGEIAVSDRMAVRTFASEVYTQFVTDRDGLGRASLLCLPQIASLFVLLRGIALRLPVALTSHERRPVLLPVRRYRRAAALGMLSIPLVLYGLPLVLLAVQAGSARGISTFAPGRLADSMLSILRTRGDVLAESLFWSAVAGALTAGAALAISLSTRSNPRGRAAIALAMLVLLAIPGPVLGYGIKSLIGRAIDLEEWLGFARGPLRYWLYDEPNPLPVMLAQGWRFLPLAWLILDSAVRSIPGDTLDSARSLGASRYATATRVLLPMLRTPLILATMAVSALSIAEVGGSNMVQIPGRETFAAQVFDQLHYGVSSTLSGLSLAMVLAIGAAMSAGLAIERSFRPGEHRLDDSAGAGSDEPQSGRATEPPQNSVAPRASRSNRP